MTVAAFSSSSRSKTAVEAAEDLLAPLGGRSPVLGFVYGTPGIGIDALRRRIAQALPGTALVGATVCQQAASDQGAGMTAVGLFLSGDGFRAGAAAGTDEGTPRALGARLVREALARARMKPDEARFAVVHGTPGIEADLVAGLAEVLPPKVHVVGGTAADDDIGGKWCVFDRDCCHSTGAAVLVCDWPGPMGVTYQSGYTASGTRGTVTRAHGRRIYEIDGEPARDVYQRWIGRTLPVGESVLGETTLEPLGVVRGRAGGLDLHVLVHPERVLEDGSITTFAEVQEGEIIERMRGSTVGLSGRGVSVTRFACNRAGIDPKDVAAALIVYCAGCSLALDNEVEEMVRRTAAALPAPFVMPFTFGEQGVLTRGRVEHGNLMSVPLVLGRF